MPEGDEVSENDNAQAHEMLRSDDANQRREGAALLNSYTMGKYPPLPAGRGPMPEETLYAPCKWCGYNGPGYWQAGTHSVACPWRTVGGEASRVALLPSILRMPDTDLPTLQQRVERVLDDVATIQGIKHWSPPKLARGLKAMNDDFANDDEAEIAHAASAWLRKVNR
jgi:hypothetical protein